MEEKKIFPQEMYDMFGRIAAQNNNQLRLCKTLVAGFKATDERDINYMDSYMDSLYDFMDPASDTESVYREFIAHIATFDPNEAKERTEFLEERLGYKAHIIYAAAFLAKRLHNGQKDKGGNDYYRSHLLQVARSGNDWKEKVVGFLHDAAEDCEIDVPTIISRLKELIDTWLNNPDDTSWIDEFDDDLMVYPEKYIPPTDEEWHEIATALTLLNHHLSPTRQEYITKIKQNRIALKVKLNDLKNNMDLTRIPNPKQKDYDRLERYKKEYQELLEALRDMFE